MADKPVVNRPSFATVNGLRVPSFVLQEQVDKLKSFKLYPDDVWINTYPKSGTTWTMQIVRLIRNKGVLEDKKLSSLVPWPEAISDYPEVNLDAVPRPRTFKSHFPYNFLPCGLPHTTPCKYIYVIRNPKDVAVSYFLFTKLAYLPDMEWEKFWKIFIEGDAMYGSYFDHLMSWWPHRNDKNVLFLKYEDMQSNLSKAISEVAYFLGEELSSDVIAKIADLSSFKKMKKDTTANFSWMNVFDDKNGEPMFIRKGIVGDWKNHLTEEQSAQMDALCALRLQGTDLYN